MGMGRFAHTEAYVLVSTSQPPGPGQRLLDPTYSPHRTTQGHAHQSSPANSHIEGTRRPPLPELSSSTSLQPHPPPDPSHAFPGDVGIKKVRIPGRMHTPPHWPPLPPVTHPGPIHPGIHTLRRKSAPQEQALTTHPNTVVPTGVARPMMETENRSGHQAPTSSRMASASFIATVGSIPHHTPIRAT
jgi:hypothetical protein